jgi:membrane protein required for colicin V production
MTAEILDLGILVLIILSAIIGLIRGFGREFLSMVTWVTAFVVTLVYMKPLAAAMPFAQESEVVRLGIAIAILFFGVLVLGAIISHLLSSIAFPVVLNKVDHLLGGLFGVVRGVLIITLLVLLVGGVTAAPKQAWWKDSHLMPWFDQMVVVVKGMIPEKLPDFMENLMKKTSL